MRNSSNGWLRFRAQSSFVEKHEKLESSGEVNWSLATLFGRNAASVPEELGLSKEGVKGGAWVCADAYSPESVWEARVPQ
jgi:hypothetical protein